MKSLQKLVLGGQTLLLPPASDQLQTLELFTAVQEQVKGYASQRHFRFPRLARLCMPPHLFLKPDAAGLVSLTSLTFATNPQYRPDWVRAEERPTTARPPPEQPVLTHLMLTGSYPMNSSSCLPLAVRIAAGQHSQLQSS